MREKLYSLPPLPVKIAQIAVRPTGEDRRGGDWRVGVVVVAGASDEGEGSVAVGGVLVELATAAAPVGDLGLDPAVLPVALVLFARGLRSRAVVALLARVTPHQRLLGAIGLELTPLTIRQKLHREDSDQRHTGLMFAICLRGVPTLVARLFYQVFLKTATGMLP